MTYDLIGESYRKDLERMLRLIEDGIDVNTPDQDGRTALIFAVLSSEPDVEIIQSLIASGADVDHADTGQQWTALHFAARDGKLKVVEALIKGGASIDAVDVFGNTPLFRSVFESSKDYSVIKALLRAGANPNIENLHGVSARGLAETLGNTELVELLG